ncbi:MAG: GIY-YIG nuclease family protein [Chloroflexota bacterium]
MAAKQYYVYIVATAGRVIYTGVTSNLTRRVYEHKNKATAGFTSKYGVDNLVYYEVFDEARAAIEREKQIKSWRREKKVGLIEAVNPDWLDLS